jgi:hygromycin-B 4-O-kinase
MVATGHDDAERARGLLGVALRLPIEELGAAQPLAGGFFSRAYACRAGEREYVVRLNRVVFAAEGFDKDAYAWRQFAAPELPIPRVLASGASGEDVWAISDRVPGRTLDQLTADERRALLPATLATLDAIGRAELGATHGYGPWDAEGNAPFASWREFLAAASDNDSAGFYENWHALFHESFLERAVYEAIYRHMLRLADYCPEQRALVHNDYQFENVLAEPRGTRITGVIDWANALYGDPLYDVARLAVWSAHPGWWHDDGAQLLRARYGQLPRYAERLACYTCHLGLDDLRFYAKTNNRPTYTFFRNRLLALIAT